MQKPDNVKQRKIANAIIKTKGIKVKVKPKKGEIKALDVENSIEIMNFYGRIRENIKFKNEKAVIYEKTKGYNYKTYDIDTILSIVYECLNSNGTKIAISTKYNISRQTLNAWLKKYSTNGILSIVYDSLNSNCTQREILEKYNISRTTFKTWLGKYVDDERIKKLGNLNKKNNVL